MKRSPSEKGKGPNIEATLERIISDAAADNQFDLYKLVNYRRGGAILESYAMGGGTKEVDKICKQQLIRYTYNSGAGRMVTLQECLNWRNRHIGEVSIPITSSGQTANNNKDLSESSSGTATSSLYSSGIAPYNILEDHMACWMLEKRGALGENPLHVLVICDTPTHTRVAKIILHHFPKLASDIIEGSEYYGLSPLHLAVAYNNMELVHAFVMAGANVNERAVGRFFMPTDQQLKSNKNTNYDGLSYLGEYPLSWAACCENEAIYNYLLDNGADPNLQDYFGNMVLHMVVISNKLGMYGYALRHPKKPANNEILNNAGLTPLTLACTLGRNKIFREMLELSAVEFWRFCNVTCSAYPLIALDTIRPDGGTNWKSALMIILNGETDEHLDMLEGGVVQRLLEDKWKTFARTQFLKRLAVLVLHLLVLSLAVYLRPPITDELLVLKVDAKIIVRYCAEVAALIGCGNFVILQQGSEIRSQGVKGFISNMTRSPAKFIFLLSNICMIVCVPCRLLNLRLVEDTLLIFTLPGSWFFLMFFAGAVRLTGPFVTMIYSMIAGDMVRFGIIYLIISLGFSQAFFFLFKTCYVGVQDQDDTNVDMYNTYYGTWMALYHMTLGSYQYGDFSKPKYSGLTLGIFVIFMVMVPILLLNMLIAMMGNTYSNVISKSEKEFVKQWAKIVLALERSVDKDSAKEYLNSYAINLGPPPEPGGLQMKGVMAINCKPKTKAQQRKGAFLNWRRMGKKVINEMRKYNCKGEQLLSKLSQVAASKKVSRRGSFPRLLGESLEEQDTNNEQPPQRTGGGFHEALAQLAFAHDLDLDAPTPTFSTQLTGAKATTPSPNGMATPVPSDETTICEVQTINQTSITSSPPPPYQIIQNIPLMFNDGDVATIALMAVQATVDRPMSAHATGEPLTTATVTGELLTTATATGEPPTTAVATREPPVCSTATVKRPMSATTTENLPMSAKATGDQPTSAEAIGKQLTGATATEDWPTSTLTTLPPQRHDHDMPKLRNEKAIVSEDKTTSSPVTHSVPKDIELSPSIPSTSKSSEIVPLIPETTKEITEYVLSVRPKTSSHKLCKTELLVLPANLKDVRATSATTVLVATPTRRHIVRSKTRRRRAGISSRLRKLANKVGAMAPIQVVATVDVNRPNESDGATASCSNEAAGTSLHGESVTISEPTSESLVPPSPQPNAMNPMMRWSTTSLLSMTNLVAWEDEDDSTDKEA